MGFLRRRNGNVQTLFFFWGPLLGGRTGATLLVYEFPPKRLVAAEIPLPDGVGPRPQGCGLCRLMLTPRPHEDVAGLPP